MLRASSREVGVWLAGERHWECPNCDVTDVTHRGEANRMHTCRGLFGLTTPMVTAGTRCKVTAHEREDYVASEIVQVDGRGRPVMNVITTREDGQDCTVYVPLATAQAD